MERGAPERLLHERYMPLDTPFRLFRHQLEWTVPAHWHKFFEIAFATSGAAIELEGETLLQVEQEFARM